MKHHEKNTSNLDKMVHEMRAAQELFKRHPELPHKIASLMSSRDKGDPHTYKRIISRFTDGKAAPEDFNTGYEVDELIRLPLEQLLKPKTAA